MQSNQRACILIWASTPTQTQELETLIAPEVSQGVFLRPTTIAEALEQLQTAKPNLVLAEALLNDSSVAEILKTYPREQRKFPIFVLSPQRSDELFQEMFALGADDFMFLPIDSLVLQSKVRSLLSQHYMSPLSFLGKREGLASFRIHSEVQVTAVDEEHAVLLSEYPIARGTQMQLTLTHEIVLQLTVQATERTEGDASQFQITAHIDPMSESLSRSLRQFLLKTSAQTTVESTRTQ